MNRSLFFNRQCVYLGVESRIPNIRFDHDIGSGGSQRLQMGESSTTIPCQFQSVMYASPVETTPLPDA